ncbi:MAG TPA: hypothetical protein VI386_34320 [Candidatus Sulfotelmatobacter sp.]
MRKDRFVVSCAVAALLTISSLILPFALHAATPSSGTLTSTGTKLTYTGSTATENPANFDPSTCQTAGYCDVYTLTINLSNTFRTAHPDFRVNIQFAWSGNTNEFDMYDYYNGAPIATSVNSFVTSQLTRLEHPANGVYTIYASMSLGVPGTVYTGTVTLQPTPPATQTIAASYTLDPDGKFGPQMFEFTSDQFLPATALGGGAAGQDVEPGIVIDPFGNIYISAIEGVPAGSDLWRSTDSGNTFTFLGKPDQGAGGGDEDLAVGFPFAADSTFGDSTGRLFYSSLNLADIALETTHDEGNSFIPGDSPAKVVDRMWLAGVGTSRDYLVTVQLGADLSGTDSLIVTESDDGGITYPNGAIVNQALLAGTPETGFHSNIVAYPGYLTGGTPNSSVYTTFTSANGVDLYVASCPAPCNLPLLPLSGPPSKLRFTSTLAFTAPPGATVGNVFTPVAVDNDGTVYVAFSMQQLDTNGVQTGQNVYVIWSKNGGKNWSKALQLNNPADPGTATSMLPWLTAGDQGYVGAFWYGTDVVGDPNNQTIFANAKWKMYYAFANVNGTTPAVQYVVASGTSTGTADQMAGVVHYGSICTQGLNCDTSVPAGNRELAEYSELIHDPMGMIHMAFSEDDVTAGSAFTWYSKQTAGPTLIPNIGTGDGYFTIGSGTGSFGFLLQNTKVANTQLNEGTLTYLDNSAHILLSDTIGFSSKQLGKGFVLLGGTGTLQDGTSVNFTAKATAGGPGTGTFTISWPGYTASGTLVQGQIVTK